MDFSSLKEQVSNLTLYDIKAGVRKVQNVGTPIQHLPASRLPLPTPSALNQLSTMAYELITFPVS